MTGLLFRRTGPADWRAAIAIHREAFGGELEARIAESLFLNGEAVISLLAVKDGEPVGHLALSPIRIDGRPSSWLGMGPVAVRPAVQRQGIGTALIREALQMAEAERAGGVVVLGEPSFYGRFGFTPASQLGLACTYPAPADAFMALQLKAAPPAGVVHYARAFAEAGC